MIQFTINSKLPALNEYINAERRNKYAAANIKDKATNKVAALAKIQIGHIELSSLYDVQISWSVPDNRIDSDNVFFAVKFILDGLVTASILKNDNRKHIRNISHTIGTRKNQAAYCIVNMKEVHE